MDLGIAGKRAVVAGSSAGLGLGTAKALAEAGCEVVVNGRTVDRVHDASAEVPGSKPIVGDVSTVEGAQKLVADARAALGGIDILVANAGGPPAGTFESTPLEQYAPALELSLLSTVAMCYSVVPGMRDQRWGRILAITSYSVRRPIPTIILSNTARAGLTGFLNTLAGEVAADGITVNTIQPGAHKTERLQSMWDDLDELASTVPAQTIGDPEDFGAVAAFLCSAHARYVTGTSLHVDGGVTTGLH